MTEQEMRVAAQAIADLARERGLDCIEVSVEVRANSAPRASIMHGRRYEHMFGRGETAEEALTDLRARVAALPDAEARKLRAAVAALEAAREACLAIDADDVAASLTAAVSRLSEDLIEHMRAQA